MNQMGTWNSVEARWRKWWTAGLSPEAEGAYRTYQLELGTWSWRWMCLASAIATAVWWPTDIFIFRRAPQAIEPFFIERSIALVSCVTLFFLQPRVPLFRAHPYVTLGSGALLVCVAAGYEFGRIGGPSTPWFTLTPLILVTPVAIALTLRERVVTTTVFAVGLTIGFFGFHPAYLSDPLAPCTLSYVLFTMLASIASGVVTDRVRKRTFVMRRAIESQARELSEWNDRLTGMVREQTEELRLLAAHRESARETERAHIARELHDELGQELTAIRYSLELLRVRYRQQPDGVAGNIDDLEGLVGRTRLTIRSILTELRPLVLDHLGLVEAARWLANRTEERAGLKCVLDLPTEELKVPEQVSISAFRILQETLTNATRHAKATQVDISIRQKDGAIELRVKDNGVGFVPRPAGKGLAGMGLVGMRERARDLGGTLEFDSSPGLGTTLTAHLPLTGLWELAS